MNLKKRNNLTTEQKNKLNVIFSSWKKNKINKISISQIKDWKDVLSYETTDSQFLVLTILFKLTKDSFLIDQNTKQFEEINSLIQLGQNVTNTKAFNKNNINWQKDNKLFFEKLSKYYEKY